MHTLCLGESECYFTPARFLELAKRERKWLESYFLLAERREPGWRERALTKMLIAYNSALRN